MVAFLKLNGVLSYLSKYPLSDHMDALLLIGECILKGSIVGPLK